MITPAEIRSKAEKKYTAFLRAWLRGESFFPIRIQGRLASGSTPWEQLSPWIKTLNAGSKAEKGIGYTVHFGEPVLTRKHGKQTLPERITIELQADLLPYIQKTKEFQQFVADVGLVRAALPALEPWLQQHPQAIIDHAGDWRGLVAVCQFFLEHPRPGHYIRELPVAVHSKFIEQNKGILRDLLDALLDEVHIVADASNFEDRFGLKKPPITVRFRVLDPGLLAALGLPSSDLSLPLEDLARLPLLHPKVIVCENLMPFLTIPSISNGICIFGEGNAVSALAATWLEKAEIHYWGDLDVQGFRFLANLRRRYPQVQSMLMDAPTLEEYRAYCVAGTTDEGSVPDPLTPEELAVHKRLREGNLRLEQERISHGRVIDCLRGVFNIL